MQCHWVTSSARCLISRLVTHADAHLLPHAKTSVLFLSDGRPSDRVDERELPQLLGGQLRALHSATLGRLASFQLLGFGEAHERMLKSMAAMVPGNLATFNVVSGRAGYTSLAQSVSSFSSSVALSRQSSVSYVDGAPRALRQVHTTSWRMAIYPECEIFLPPKTLGDFVSRLRPLPGLHDLEISSMLLGSGGERYAYLMRFVRDNAFTESSEEWVVKESMHERSEAEELEFHRKSLGTQQAATELANRFNEEAEMLGLDGLPKVGYMTCCFVSTGKTKEEHLDEPPSRPLFAERKIDGEFRKWNSNNGQIFPTVVDASAAAANAATASSDGHVICSSDLVPQAFSHFTACYSERPLSAFVGPTGKRGSCLVCDIQGSFDRRKNTFKFSDPVIHSDLGTKNLFGGTDGGRKGIDAFMRGHKCNEVCRLLKLPHNDKFVEESIKGEEKSQQNTSLISVAATNHLAKRQVERAITTRELQGARKHGTKERQLNGNLRHEHGEVHHLERPEGGHHGDAPRLASPSASRSAARIAGAEAAPHRSAAHEHLRARRASDTVAAARTAAHGGG